MQSAIEYAAIPTINLTPLFLVTNPLTNSSQSDILQVKPPHSCKSSKLRYMLGRSQVFVYFVAASSELVTTGLNISFRK